MLVPDASGPTTQSGVMVSQNGTFTAIDKNGARGSY